jgi:hypothetical protein
MFLTLRSLSGKKPDIPLQWKVFVTCIATQLYFRGEMKRKDIALLGVPYKEKRKVKDHPVWGQVCPLVYDLASAPI